VRLTEPLDLACKGLLHVKKSYAFNKGEDIKTSWLVMCLLEEGIEDEDVYRRVGLTRWVKRILFQNCPFSTVILI
jgi:hypothetical protein